MGRNGLVMKPGSVIVDTGSITGIDGLVDYSMTKGGIHASTRALSGNLIDKGIRVNATAAGPVWAPSTHLTPSDVVVFGAKTRMKRLHNEVPSHILVSSARKPPRSKRKYCFAAADTASGVYGPGGRASRVNLG